MGNNGSLDCIIMGQRITSTSCIIDGVTPLPCESHYGWFCMFFTVVTMLSCYRNTYSSYAYYSPVIHLKVCTTVLQVMSSQLLSVLSGSPKEIILSPWQPIFQTPCMHNHYCTGGNESSRVRCRGQNKGSRDRKRNDLNYGDLWYYTLTILLAS